MKKREVRFSLCRIARLLKKIARTLMWWQHIFNTTNFLIPNTFSYFLILNTFSYLILSHTFSCFLILSHFFMLRQHRNIVRSKKT
jgi:hypothetical protein